MQIGVRADQARVEFAEGGAGVSSFHFAAAFQLATSFGKRESELLLATLVSKKVRPHGFAFHEDHVVSIDFGLAFKNGAARVLSVPFPRGGYVDDANRWHGDFVGDRGVALVPQPRAGDSFELEMKIAFTHNNHPIIAPFKSPFV